MPFYIEEPPFECDECLEKENRLGDIQYWFRAILDQLYGLEEFNAQSLENYLDELSGYLNMKLPAKDLCVVGQERNDMTQMLDSWKKYSKEFFQDLAKAGA